MREGFLGVQRHFEQYGCTTIYFAGDAGEGKFFAEVVAQFAGLQTEAVERGGMAVEGFAVFEEDLLDGGPVVGVDKGQGIAGAIFIIDADDAVVDVALHVVGAAGHEQVGTGGFAFEGNLQAVGIVVPEGGEGDVMAFGGGAEGDAEFGFQYAAAF